MRRLSALWVAGAVVATLGGSLVIQEAADASTTVHNYVAKTTINGRQQIGQPANAPGAVVDKYKQGTLVPVVCQAGRQGVLWDKTSDKLWVPDEYLKTGTDGYVKGVARCAVDDQSVGSTVHGRNSGPAGPRTGTVAQRVARVIAAAKSWTGKGLIYAWGGGGKGGPSWGTCCSPSHYDDRGRWGFDCSGLTLYAFWRGAGIDIGANTGAQYGAGTKVPVSKAKPGDLVFWGTPSSTHHVALYLGNNQIVEADVPRDSHSVRVTSLSAPGNDLIRYAVRVIK